MQETGQLIHTKLRLPYVRPGLVSRPRLQNQIALGLTGPLTLITAPAGFGKTTLVASCITGCGMPVAWLSLDKNDNQAGRFLSYLVAALQQADHTVGSEAVQLLAAAQEALPEAVLTSLINELDRANTELALVLDDYQYVSSQAVHEAMVFLLDHRPHTLHIVIATRSDPPLPLARLRARGQTVELRAADLRFTESEAAQFLNDIMGLGLDARSVAMLEERTEGWIAGLQMAALSMQDREDVLAFIEGFSGTNRYILDYLLEEVLASQPPEIQHFLLHSSVLERLTASLCEAVTEIRAWSVRGSSELLPFSLDSQAILEHLERANLFLIPLDEKRVWYRYHYLFGDLLRTQLQKSLGTQGVTRLHLRAAEWYEQNGSILEAIHHASMASDDEMVERLIEQHYMEMVNRGEMSWIRYWMGKLNKELIYRRPWLCLYEALSRSWFGQLEEANLLLSAAENRIRSTISAPSGQSMLGYYAFVKSRVTAMQGDTQRAIEYCCSARENIPVENLALQNEISITLGFEYFLYGDFVSADKILHETIQSGYFAGAINNPVAAYAVLARLKVYQGQLQGAYDILQDAARVIRDSGGQYLGATGLVEVGTGAIMYEWNDLEPALTRVKRGLDCLPWWGKADDTCLAYSILVRILIALGKQAEAVGTIEKAAQLIRTCGVFSEARSVVETTQVKLRLASGDLLFVGRWSDALKKRFNSHDPYQYEDELTFITQARVFVAQNKPDEAICLLSRLEESAQSAGRLGRLIEILNLKALALQAAGDITQADAVLLKSLMLAEPERYQRIYLDEGLPMHRLLAHWLAQEQVQGAAHSSASPLRNYAAHLLSQFDTEPQLLKAVQEKASPAGNLYESLSQRELEVLSLIALGRTNQEIARQLIVSPGTVKAHTASIYRKLDVANRTEAVARSRQLAILP